MHLLGLLAANSSLSFFISLCSRVVRVYIAYQKYARLVCCKNVEELDISVLWVELAIGL